MSLPVADLACCFFINACNRKQCLDCHHAIADLCEGVTTLALVVLHANCRVSAQAAGQDSQQTLLQTQAALHSLHGQLLQPWLLRQHLQQPWLQLKQWEQHVPFRRSQACQMQQRRPLSSSYCLVQGAQMSWTAS